MRIRSEEHLEREAKKDRAERLRKLKEEIRPDQRLTRKLADKPTKG